jgi:hypothetical protein
MSLNEQLKITGNDLADSGWMSLYKVAGTSALLAVLVMVLEIFITLLPGGGRTESGIMTVIDWFALFHNNWFMGLRNLGLMNIISIVLGIPIYLAFYFAHRHANKAYAILAAVLFFIGLSVYIANNTAFAVFALSGKYAAATTDAQRSLIAAAGEALLAQGESHTPGTFTGFFLCEIAGITISVVMFHGKVFSKPTAITGIIGSGFLLIFDACSAFVPALFQAAMIFVMIGGISSLVWYVLIARRFFQLGHRN